MHTYNQSFILSDESSSTNESESDCNETFNIERNFHHAADNSMINVLDNPFYSHRDATETKEILNIQTGFSSMEANKNKLFNSPLKRKKNIQHKYIDTPLKTKRQSSEILLESLKNKENTNDFHIKFEDELGTSRKSSENFKYSRNSPFASDGYKKHKKVKDPSHLIFQTPEILDRIMYFAFYHEDPYTLPPFYSQEYDLNGALYTSKLFYSIGSTYNKEKLVIKNYRQLQKFNDLYRFKNKSTWLAPKTLIINFGSDGVFKEQQEASSEFDNGNSSIKLFNEICINCENLIKLEIRSNRFIKELPFNLQNLTKLRSLKLPGLCNLTTESFERLFDRKSICKLVSLDLRNCYSISELSLYKILIKTYSLRHLNLNRKVLSSTKKNDAFFKENFTLSDNILNALQISRSNLETLAISGSKISDYGIWHAVATTPEIRLNLRRLSVNECFELKDGFFRLFESKAFPNLQVLELKSVKNKVDVNNAAKALFDFRLSQELHHSKPLSLILDGAIDQQLDVLQKRYNKDVGFVVIEELFEWVNSSESD